MGDRFSSCPSIWGGPLTLTPSRSKCAAEMDHFGYHLAGEILRVGTYARVLDFGIQIWGLHSAFAPDAEQGTYVAGKARLCFDGMEPIQIADQNWCVEAIWADLTAWRQIDDRAFALDPEKNEFQPVQSTREIRTHGYVLQCRLL